MDEKSIEIQNDAEAKRSGTLAIDLGNSTTVVAFQNEKDQNPLLLNLTPISRAYGEVPSLIGFDAPDKKNLYVGQQVLEIQNKENIDLTIISDFKRWIGSRDSELFNNSNLTPEEAGEILIHSVWKHIPPELTIKRLVLTAPVETYRRYRSWLNKVCSNLPVQEVALVDEPTAAAMGAGLPPGSKLLVIDIGGSTIDLSIVALEGGEGKAEPIAQLIRFGGENLEGKSTQVLRCAKVLGKSGQRLGGRDFDRWIANHLFPDLPLSRSLLNTAEKLKCRLSDEAIKSDEYIIEKNISNSNEYTLELKLNRNEFESILEKQGLLNELSNLLESTLKLARANGCGLNELRGVVVVGGGARVPLIRKWIKEKCEPTPLLTPPPIEAVAKGALKLTPGVTIRDVLQRGASIRCWNQKSNKHVWHPLFMAGQPWPTNKPLEILIAASKEDQSEVDLIIGEPDLEGANEIVYINGVPTVQESNSIPQVIQWSEKSQSLPLDPPGIPGQDCLKLNFSIDETCHLLMEGIDLRTGNQFEKISLGSIR